MRLERLPEHWLSTTAGRQFLRSSAVEVLVLVKCVACGGRGWLTGEACRSCVDSALAGYHLFRVQAAALHTALANREDAPPQDVTAVPDKGPPRVGDRVMVSRIARPSLAGMDFEVIQVTGDGVWLRIPEQWAAMPDKVYVTFDQIDAVERKGAANGD